MAKSPEITKLVQSILKHNEDYHEKGKPSISDDEYDALKNRLFELDPKNPVFKKVGSPASKRKVTLPTYLGSLDKIYVDDEKKFNNWMKANKASSYLVTDKLDGISLLVGNKNGKMFAYTRGNGSQGSDISHLIPYIKSIPDLKPGTMVRGELVMEEKDFKRFKDEFDNSRNLVSGISNFKGIHKAVKHTKFIVHEVISKNVSLDRVASQLKNAGAFVAPFKVFKKPTLAQLAKYLTKRKKESPVTLDGIVLDDMHGNRIAIKNVNDVATGTIKDILWQVSRHGYLTPVLILESPVTLAGAKISRITAHNALRVKKDKLGPGAIISFNRSGEVIPKLLSVITPSSKPSFPPKGTYEWVDDTNIVSTSKDDLESIEIQKIVHFMSVLGVKDFKENMISVLYASGLKTIEKIVKANATRFEKAGFGPVQAKKLYSALHTALDNSTMPKMMVASGLFPRGFGLTSSKAVYEVFEDRMFTVTDAALRSRLALISGIGPSAISGFLEGRKVFNEFITKLEWEPKKQKKAGTKFAGKIFVFTGVRDSKLQTYLENNGAKVSSSVSKNTSYLIVKDKSVNTEKVRDAREAGTKIITIDEARKL